jgi:NTE family protein
VLDIIDDQVRSLRKRRLIDSYLRRERTGAYWGIRARIADYIPATDPLGCANRDPSALAEVPTRLEAMPTSQQERIINWGYAICDSSLRRFFSDDAQELYGVKIDAPGGFPYARGY